MLKIFNKRCFLTIFLHLINLSNVLLLENDLGKTPPMGWNSWNHFACNINEDLIKKTAQLFVSSGLKDAGYNYINIDDCWQISRDNNGKIIEDKIAFPSGMKALSEYIHSLGLKFGLYSDAGKMTCQKRPGSLNFEEIDAKTYAEWEVDYLKYDNCFNENISSKKRYPIMRDALLKSGRKIFYSMCQWGEENVAEWAGNVANSWRTTGDIEDKWESFLNILDKQVGLEKYSKPGAWNDPDMLEVGNGGMKDNEYQAHFALWALIKAPLLIGCDIQKMTENTKKILLNKEIIKINQDPLGKQGKRISRLKKSTDYVEVWAGELIDGWVIILFNRTEIEEEITTFFNDFGYKYSQGNLINLLNNEKYENVKNSFTAKVKPHSVVVLKLFNKSNLLKVNSKN